MFDIYARYIDNTNKLLEKAGNSTESISFLCKFAVDLAISNVSGNKILGGPFAALLVDLEQKKIASIGTNSVLGDGDPTSHAEVNAIRCAIEQAGYKSLKDLTLITSCECCPMCLSYALSLGIKDIHYIATRQDAAFVGFSDEEQYIAASRGLSGFYSKYVEPETSLDSQEVKFIERESGKTLHHFKQKGISHEPPIVRALRDYCTNHIGSFTLPYNTMVVSSLRPHPYSMIALSWAKLDIFNQSVVKYKHDKYESATGFNIGMPPEKIEQTLQAGANLHNVQRVINKKSTSPFKCWQQALESSNATEY